MLVYTINEIKQRCPDISIQKDLVKDAISNCMAQFLVEPTVKLDHIDLSELFQPAVGLKCFRQLFTENGIKYSWWGIQLPGTEAMYGLEKIEFGTNDGTRMENLWLSSVSTTPDHTRLINVIRISVHKDLF